jgi:hypothetical protein
MMNKHLLKFVLHITLMFMKTIKLLAMLLPGCISIATAQTTVTFQPDATNGKDAFIVNTTGTTNYGTNPNFAAIAWTSGGAFLTRGLLAFNLTSIPTNAVITDAKLSLYCNTTSDHTQLHSSLSGSNSSYLQKITSSWSEAGVTWNNQPTTTSTGQITLAQSTTSTENYLNIDIDALVQDWVSNPSSNYGVLLRLITESHYRSLIFASSDHGDSTKRPKLEITYTVPCVTFQPYAANGKDAFIVNTTGTTNYGTNPNFAAIAWTSGGAFLTRSLLEFDLTSIPTNASVVSANLSLYCNTTSDHTQLHSSLSGSNASYLQKNTSSWTEGSVTWNNQPTTTTTGQITLAQSTTSTQDYTGINITSMVQDWVTNPSTNYGLTLKLITESHYRSMIFASSDHGDSTKHPKLEICYVVYDTNGFSKTATTGINSLRNNNFEFQLYPNPTNSTASIEFYNPSAGNVSYSIFNIKGELIKTMDKGKMQIGNQQFEILEQPLNKGIYLIHLTVDGATYHKKLVVF